MPVFPRPPRKIAVLASDNPSAQAALHELRERYGTIEAKDAEAVVPLGGDGFMLETLHRFLDSVFSL